MNFYEHPLVAKQNLSQKDIDAIEKKYEELINQNSGKVLKIEKWGLLNFKRKIKNYTKGHFLHFKLQAQKETLDEIKSKTKLDYISCWFLLASKFIEGTSNKFSFVSTNSICQGEQVDLLWPKILSKNDDI